jgi:hypothetical protein
MYMLRLISAVLHEERGSAVSDAALDLRPAELGFLVPLVGCLLALSVWPGAISNHAFPRDDARGTVTQNFRKTEAAVCTPSPGELGCSTPELRTASP